MAFFAKFRRKLRTKNFEAHFNRKLRTLEKCSNVKKLRTTEPQPTFTGSYKKNKPSFCSGSCDKIYATKLQKKLHLEILETSLKLPRNNL